MICREYGSGKVIWRSRAQNDFFAVIQSGEVILEYRIHGLLIRSVRLAAGDFWLPRRLKMRNPHATVIMQASTDSRLYMLTGWEAESLWPDVGRARARPASRSPAHRPVAWSSLWHAGVALLILFLTWNDMTRIASGMLYAVSNGTNDPANHEQTSMTLLDYAEWLDRGAVFAYNREGYLWFQRDDLRQAETAFLQALMIDQANGPALNNQAVTYFKSGQLPQATIYQQKAARNDPDNAVVKYNYGVVLMKDRQHTKAIREFKEASFINPTWVMPYIQQGFIYIQMGDFVNAERAARRAIELDSVQQSAHLILAIALHNQGLHQEALKSVESALQMNPDDRVSRFYQARILMNLGEHDRAFSTFSHLLESTEDPQEVSRIEAELEAWQRFLQHAAFP